FITDIPGRGSSALPVFAMPFGVTTAIVVSAGTLMMYLPRSSDVAGHAASASCFAAFVALTGPATAETVRPAPRSTAAIERAGVATVRILNFTVPTFKRPGRLKQDKRSLRHEVFGLTLP